MTDTNMELISQYLGTYPININSELVSAQYRNRFYWTNIGAERFDLFGFRYSDIPIPKNRFIKLQDILENGFTDKEKARGLNTHDGVSEKSQDKFYKRYTTTGMCTAVF